MGKPRATLILGIAAVLAGAAGPAAAQNPSATNGPVGVTTAAGARDADDAHPPARDAWRWSVLEADLGLRPAYYGSWIRERDGTSSQSGDLRARAQLGVSWRASRVLTFRARLAGRFSTDQDALRFYVRDYVPTTDGLRPGDATVDELYVRWTPSDRFDLRAGRLQTGFELVGVARKSLDRNDSPSTDVTWTDGVHASVALGGGWHQNVILQRNGPEGPTNVVRSPLDVTASGSRVTIMGALQNEDRSGLWVQRGIDLTYIPASVPQLDDASSVAGARRDGYLALVARAGIDPGVSPLGGRIVLAAAAGFAPTTPPRAVLGTGTTDDGDGDGFSYQVSANLMDVDDVHSFGILHTRAGDGWLISPEIPQNNREWEARYYWQYASWGRLDARLRRRTELRAQVGAEERRGKYDLYLRTTLRFGAFRAQQQVKPAAADGTASRPER